MSIARLTLSLLAAASMTTALALSGPGMAQVLGPPPSPAPALAGPAPGAPATEPAGDWRAVLADLKLATRGAPIRKKHHMEVGASTEDGRAVIVSFDLAGRLWEVEDEHHDKKRSEDYRPVDPSAAVQAASRAGFGEAAPVEVKKHHTVVRARTKKGEAVDLHVDRSGYIYKQVWLRS